MNFPHNLVLSCTETAPQLIKNASNSAYMSQISYSIPSIPVAKLSPLWLSQQSHARWRTPPLAPWHRTCRIRSPIPRSEEQNRRTCTCGNPGESVESAQAIANATAKVKFNGLIPMTDPCMVHGAGIYTNIWGILMVNVTIHGSYGIWFK